MKFFITQSTLTMTNTFYVNYSSLLFIVLLLIASLFISSCAIKPELSNENSSFIYKPKGKKIPTIPASWNLSGKIAIINDDSNWYASYFWSKKPAQMKLLFTGPVGETHLALEQLGSQENQINRLTMGNDVYTDDSLTHLINQKMGFDIPVLSLQHWLFGQINPDQSFIIKAQNSSGQLLTIHQDNWLINYSYKSLDSEFPKRVVAENGEYKIKVFIRRRF